MKKSILQEKSYAFALRVIAQAQVLRNERQEYDLSNRFLRAGTSIGANVEEASGGNSRTDFIAKMEIAYKDARETHYWLRLLRDSSLLEQELAESLLSDCESLVKMLGKSCSTARENLKASET